jgi:hypothetical protein
VLYARTEFVKRESTQKGWGDHRGAFVAAMIADSRITVNALACWCSLTTGVRVRQLFDFLCHHLQNIPLAALK